MSSLPGTIFDKTTEAYVNSYYDNLNRYNNMSIEELISTDAGIAFPQTVAQRAAMQLLTLVDGRRMCRMEQVPERGGVAHVFQRIVSLVPSASGEADDADIAKDNIIGSGDNISVTLTMFRQRTPISDLTARQSGISLVESLGVAQGNGLNQQMNNDIYTVLKGNTTNKISLGAGADGKSYAYTYGNIFDAVGLVESSRGRADVLVTFPYGAKVSTGVDTGFFPFVRDNVGAGTAGSAVFVGALGDYLRTGQLGELFGLRLYRDNVYKSATLGADGTEYAHVLVSNQSMGWAQAWDIETEVEHRGYRKQYDVTSSCAGKSGRVLEAQICSIEHA